MQECKTGTCNFRSAQISSTGFNGTYGMPSALDEVISGRRLSTYKIHEDLAEHARRRLAIVESQNIINPIYCIYQNDTFLFQIDDTSDYPVYMKNSVLNSNPDFDFGAFNTLETEIFALQKKNITDPVIFTFTFIEAGTYVFQLASNEKKIMIITVKGLGEECADPDRYVQTVSEEALAQLGASIKEDLIVEPDYILIGSLAAILFIATGGIMISIACCLRGNWSTKDLDSGPTYRML